MHIIPNILILTQKFKDINFQLNNKNYKDNEIIADNKRDLIIEKPINLKYEQFSENIKGKKENLSTLTSYKLNNNELNDGEIKEENKNQIIHRKITRNINKRFEEIVHTNNPILLDDINIIEIKKDGNCFYWAISYFLLGSEEFYMNIKELIMEWIKHKYVLFLNFFSDDDDENNISREILAKEEYDNIQNKDSWGNYHTFEIDCKIFNLSIGVYTFNGTYLYNKYCLFENNYINSELVLIH